jgi:hypothetical protein
LIEASTSDGHNGISNPWARHWAHTSNADVSERWGSNSVGRLSIRASTVVPIVAESQRHGIGARGVLWHGANDSVIVSNVGLSAEGVSERALNQLVFAETTTINSGRETSVLNTPCL